MGTDCCINPYSELEHFCWQVSMGIPPTLGNYEVYERYYKQITRSTHFHFSFQIEVNNV